MTDDQTPPIGATVTHHGQSWTVVDREPTELDDDDPPESPCWQLKLKRPLTFGVMTTWVDACAVRQDRHQEDQHD